MKATINAGGREVTIETSSDTNISPAQLADEALRIWQQTDAAETPSQGPAFGLNASVPAADRPVAGTPGRGGRIHPVQAVVS